MTRHTFPYPEGYVEHMQTLCESLGVTTKNMVADPQWQILPGGALRFTPTYHFDMKKVTAEQREAFETLTGLRWEM